MYFEVFHGVVHVCVGFGVLVVLVSVVGLVFDVFCFGFVDC